ncbi:endonuclease/exonuclease/phosphatase family protein [Nocardia arizonensis]|uniref:endonuclease/exonuclease/phosphatase family protein n=1 Tax=Nocardia arizonensis TaxID=1141647 RepID=UPI0006CF93FB|nr:endonuclease/exonuclease/phosphatase family protein [Nocardia arizonensis]
MISVATWNVLHRVHAENWYEEVADRWPSEPDRIAAVTARLTDHKERAIALQEVSGDQLAALREALPDRAVHAMRYPRVPRPKRIATALRDRDEYLVVIADPGSTLVTAAAFADDPGKGAMVVRTDDLIVIATHVTGDGRRTGQLAHLADLAVSADAPTVLLGDFNADRETVAAALGPDFTVAPLPADPPTRPRGSGTRSQFIDQVVTLGATATDVAVEDVEGLSDHNLVRADITPN